MNGTLDFDAVVIGGGAAGLWCAATAGRQGVRVAVLERADKVGKKILVSGGGRCNFTNLGSSASHFISENPHFFKSALSRFSASDFVTVVRQHGIRFHEKKLGQLFCDDSAMQIVNLLVDECAQAGVSVHTSTNITDVTRDATEESHAFKVHTSRGVFRATALVVATGGLSYPKLCATDFGLKLAEQFGHQLTTRRPALVPLLWSAADRARYTALTGISVDVEVRLGTAHFRENLLFTHRGLSGPAILQISSYWREGAEITINFFPTGNLEDALKVLKEQRLQMELKIALTQYFPDRLAQAWCDLFLASKPLQEISLKELRKFSEALTQFSFQPAGTEGYDKAEVTVGGVSTDELSSKSMESRKVPSLYFIGEVMDVTGHLGGHNFQWAWSSGFAAGTHIAEVIQKRRAGESHD